MKKKQNKKTDYQKIDDFKRAMNNYSNWLIIGPLQCYWYSK